MQYDISSHCGIWAERKQDRDFNQRKQTLFLSEIEIILSIFQKESDLQNVCVFFFFKLDWKKT